MQERAAPPSQTADGPLNAASDSAVEQAAPPQEVRAPAAIPAAPPHNLPPATAELPPATAELPRNPAAPSQPGDNAPSFNQSIPPDEWARQELAARGFVRDLAKKVVVLDPEHGGPEIGAGGGGLGEKNVNLAIAQHLRALLEADGYQVVLTRETDTRAFTLPDDQSRNATRADLQARVDIANAAKANIFVAIHNNGAGNAGEAGTEVWYAPDRPFGHQNFLLAQEVLAGIVSELGAAGYATPNRGLKDGSRFRVFGDRVLPLFVLGNPSQRAVRATQMPGVLGESLFVSNPYEASLLAQDRIRLAIARGYQRGINRYFELQGR